MVKYGLPSLLILFHIACCLQTNEYRQSSSNSPYLCKLSRVPGLSTYTLPFSNACPYKLSSVESKHVHIAPQLLDTLAAPRMFLLELPCTLLFVHVRRRGMSGAILIWDECKTAHKKVDGYFSPCNLLLIANTLEHTLSACRYFFCHKIASLRFMSAFIEN